MDRNLPHMLEFFMPRGLARARGLVESRSSLRRCRQLDQPGAARKLGCLLVMKGYV